MGIDPGKRGAVAVIRVSDFKIYSLDVIPLIKNEIDLDQLYKLLNKWSHNKLSVYLEKVHAMPGQGVSSMFSFGRTFGLLEGMLTASATIINLVSPRKWQTTILENSTHVKNSNICDAKLRTLSIVKERFPDVDLRATKRSINPHDGIVDALGIAMYGVYNVRSRHVNQYPSPT